MNTIMSFYWLIIVLVPAIFVSGETNLCAIEGVKDSAWNSEFIIRIKDFQNGITFRGKTTNIISMDLRDISNLKFDYIKAEIKDEELIISLNDLHFIEFEEHETVSKIRIALNFRCIKSSRTLIVMHDITDTNNHEPVFLPDNNYNISIITPLGIGLPIVPIFGKILVKDVDLTNTEIIISIEPNEYFDIIYDGIKDNKKIHKFKLVTTKVLHSIDEPIIVKITAMDKDETGDLPYTTHATIKVDSESVILNLVTPSFSMPFYRANFSHGKLVFDEKIVLTEGFDENVEFKLVGEQAAYFNYSQNGNKVEIFASSLPDNIMEQNSFLLFSLEATKNNTLSGIAVINVKLP
ncbi:uncharacterized protein LOC143910242 [Arctopsyche grandis]|uniref:uncharacterized protein LOC143910242 n=1 Tax=Arctopsyche grandis TaxID=121162 RepID=UPI00406DA31A